MTPLLLAIYEFYKTYNEVSGKPKENLGYLIIGLAITIFFPFIIDGVLSMLITPVSFGSVGTTIGCIIMAVPYMRKSQPTWK
jgi:hypothetical protein